MKASIAAIAVGLLASGCASITGSEMQSVLVSTKMRSGEPLEKVECTLQSPRGLWKVSTPGSVIVNRGSEDIQVECRKDGAPSGLAKLISRAHGGMFGNIIFGGGVGALIDHSKGTGYEYPNKVVVVMGETVLIDRNDELEAAMAEPAKPGTAKPDAASPGASQGRDCVPSYKFLGWC